MPFSLGGAAAVSVVFVFKGLSPPVVVLFLSSGSVELELDKVELARSRDVDESRAAGHQLRGQNSRKVCFLGHLKTAKDN